MGIKIVNRDVVIEIQTLASDNTTVLKRISFQKSITNIQDNAEDIITLIQEDTQQSFNINYNDVVSPVTLTKQVLISTIQQYLVSSNHLELGGLGTEYIAAAAVATGKNYACIVMNDDVTFTTLTDINGVDMLTDLGIGSNTISKSFIIRARDGVPIGAVTPATGSVIGIITTQ